MHLTFQLKVSQIIFLAMIFSVLFSLMSSLVQSSCLHDSEAYLCLYLYSLTKYSQGVLKGIQTLERFWFIILLAPLQTSWKHVPTRHTGSWNPVSRCLPSSTQGAFMP